MGMAMGMASSTPARLRDLAAKTGQKLTKRDAALLIQAAHALEAASQCQARNAEVYREQLYEVVELRARLNALLESLDVAISEARHGV